MPILAPRAAHAPYTIPAGCCLADEALALCRKLGRAYFAEEDRRDAQGRTIADPVRLERLAHARRRAADRWRRRMGYAALYHEVTGRL